MSTCNRCDGQGAYETAASRGEGTHEICLLCNGTGEQPAPVSATEPERRTYDPVGALISLPCYVCGKEERERPMTLSDKWRHEDPNDCITTLRARLAKAERVTEDSAIIDALAAREIEVECMGTTVPYWNVVVVKTGEMFTASPSLVKPTSLREALTRALTAARGGG